MQVPQTVGTQCASMFASSACSARCLRGAGSRKYSITFLLQKYAKVKAVRLSLHTRMMVDRIQNNSINKEYQRLQVLSVSDGSTFLLSTGLGSQQTLDRVAIRKARICCRSSQIILSCVL